MLATSITDQASVSSLWTTSIFGLVIYVIVVVALWRVFAKAGWPGILAIIFYMLTVQIVHGRRLPSGERQSLRERLVALRGVWAVGLLFIAIIGGIYAGIVTPTEAAAAGAALTAIIGILRGRLGPRALVSSLAEALRTSVSIYMILIGALLFGYFLTITQTPQKITSFLVALDLGAYPTLALVLVFFLLLGCILDAMAMIILLVPIVFPVVQALGFDPIWFGIIVVMTVELGLITPPVGMNVFVINSITPNISLYQIYKGVMPFVLVDILRLILLVAFPAIVMFLPRTMQ